MTSPLITKAEVNSVFQGRSLLAEKRFSHQLKLTTLLILVFI